MVNETKKCKACNTEIPIKVAICPNCQKNQEPEKSGLKNKNVILIWALIGPILLLLGIIAELLKVKIADDWLYLYSIIYDFTKNIGIAITISSIFSYILGTDEFLEFIKDKLISIIISKEFIKRLNPDERKDLMKVVLKPTKSLSDVYSGINTYFNKHIDESMLLFNKQFRSGYNIVGEAYIDNETGKLVVETDMSYRMYKVVGDFEQVAVGFEDTTSKLIFTKLFSPNGDEHIVSSFDLEPKDNVTDSFLKNDPAIQNCYATKVPEEFRKYDRIDVTRRVMEYGEDHWHLYSYRAVSPCDKFSLTIRCRGNVFAKRFITYGPGENFKVDNEGTRITISCSDWLQPGLGVSILFAENCPDTSGTSCGSEK